MEQAMAELAQAKLAEALAKMEQTSASQTQEEVTIEASQPPPMVSGSGAGSGAGGEFGGGWRQPNREERDIQKGAERFLRNLIDNSESSQRSLTDQPSAVIDGAALAAWKAGGQIREPHFFVRTRRSITPTPPVEIAVLVDVSSSMEVLQEPSAVLSWALASAAIDLRNFAGRGQQISSCLIHWGDSVRVMQKPGELLPGIREVSCHQGTKVMGQALAAVEKQIPGFFNPSRNANRLVVHFTDWKLTGEKSVATDYVGRTLAAGVNMLSVVPSSYSARYADLDGIIRAAKVQRGYSAVLRYNEAQPDQVWSQAAQMLGKPAPDLAARLGF